MESPKIDRARRQTAIWVLTHDLVAKLSEHLGTSKTEVMHLAVLEMAKRCLPDALLNRD